MEWQKDPDTKQHFLPINDKHSMICYRSSAGDYVCSCYSEDFGCGGEVEYRSSLQSAKTWCEKQALNGEWIKYTPEALD